MRAYLISSRTRFFTALIVFTVQAGLPREIVLGVRRTVEEALVPAARLARAHEEALVAVVRSC